MVGLVLTVRGGGSNIWDFRIRPETSPWSFRSSSPTFSRTRPSSRIFVYTKVKRSKDDVSIIANRLENDDGEQVGITRMDVHLPGKFKQNTILACLDNSTMVLGIPFNQDCFFSTSDKSVQNQMARKAMTYSRGSIIEDRQRPTKDLPMHLRGSTRCKSRPRWTQRQGEKRDADLSRVNRRTD